MSLVLCDVCEAPIDTDEDLDAWQPYHSVAGSWVCEKCREEAIDHYTENLPFGD